MERVTKRRHDEWRENSFLLILFVNWWLMTKDQEKPLRKVSALLFCLGFDVVATQRLKNKSKFKINYQKHLIDKKQLNVRFS